MKLTRSIYFLIIWCLPFIATKSHASSGKLSAELSSDRRITVAISERIPFVVLGRNKTPMGLDVQILENFAKRFHLQINYIIINSSLNYVFSNIQHFRAFSIQTNLSTIDQFAGALDGTILTNKKFIASRPYYYDVLTWCVQKNQPIPKWRNIFHLCRDPVVWFMQTLMSFSVLLMGYFIHQFEDDQKKWDWHSLMLASIACICGLPCQARPKNISHRIFVGFCLFGSLLYNICILSAIINIMKKPLYSHQVDSIQEIIKEPYALAGDEFALEHLRKQNETYPSEMLENFVVCSNLDYCLEQLDHTSDMAVAISREHASNSRVSPHLYCFEKSEIIFEYALKFLVRKDFPYFNELNWFIGRASENGLIEKWRIDHNFRSPQTYYDRNIHLTLEHVCGIGMILSNCLVFAAFCLFLEHFIYKKVRTINSVRIWRFAEMIIDPDRHFWLENKKI